MRIREIITETALPKLSNTFAEIPVDDGKSQIVNYSNRVIVLPRYGNVHIPFYISTGSGGKTNVPAGKWYPFFGIGSDGWLNKTVEKDINNYYYSTQLKSMAQYLDRILGDLRPLANQVNSPIPELPKSSWSVINQDLNPTPYKGDRVQFIENVHKILIAVGAR